MNVIIAPMELGDIPAVMEVDRQSFPLPWKATSYEYELKTSQCSHFFVALAAGNERQVVGYAGYWRIVDEAHIATLAVHPAWRGQGLGERLLVTMLSEARATGAVKALLEVRASNEIALRIYSRHGFVEGGRRARYYRDNGEDALLLTAELTRTA